MHSNQIDMFSEYSARHGVVEYQGVTYALAGEADHTSRLLPGGYTNCCDVADGEAYDFEMGASAIDADHNRYYVTWIFTSTQNDDDRGLNDYDYRIAHRVVEA